MDLFYIASKNDQAKPLSELLRPKTLEEFVGQSRILGSKSIWLKILKQEHLPHLIFWGPPGTGKTSLARFIISTKNYNVVEKNAIDLGAKELKEIGDSARRKRLEYNQKTLLFIDEIHRLNKSQQDILLPYLESFDFILIGATTENPSYELNSALLSRSKVLIFEPHTYEDLKLIWSKACELTEKCSEKILSPESIEYLLKASDGDARRLLNFAEIILNLEAKLPLQLEELKELLNYNHIRYDKAADQHYDLMSALIKSIRGSDADAGLYYLGRMIMGGEEPLALARRLIILASEDVGNADPRALAVAVSGFQAVEYVGLPEAEICLAQVVTYLASAPKSNRSYLGIKKAKSIIEKTGTLAVPLDLRSSQTKFAKSIGYGKNYQYPHDFPKSFVSQKYLPKEIESEKFYEPSDRGFEKNIKEYQEWLKKNNS